MLSPPITTPAERLIQQAWIGDAVLLLYARRKVLADAGKLDAAMCARLTSNHFLSSFGEPTKVEAEIGRVYEQSGLESAFTWIDEQLMPMFQRQEENRTRKNLKR